jgi:CRISPR type III-B/RAMP module-associated protein Cmr5
MTEADQRRAAFAYKRVEYARGKGYAQDYARLAKDLPAMIRKNGLGQALAFLAVKDADGKSEARQLLQDLIAYTKNPAPGWSLLPAAQNINSGESLLQTLFAQPAPAYRRCEYELSQLAVWLKRFSEAFLEKKAASAGKATAQ